MNKKNACVTCATEHVLNVYISQLKCLFIFGCKLLELKSLDPRLSPRSSVGLEI